MATKVLTNLLIHSLELITANLKVGNSNINEDEAIELIDVINHFTNREDLITKYEACKYLNISRATFDNYVREGKLPKGKKMIGSVTKFYTKKELDECIEKIKKSKKKTK